MATGDQIKALIDAHFKGDNEQFKNMSLKIAASEARKGHTQLAKEIKNLIDNSKNNKIIKFSNENPLIDVQMPNVNINELILSVETEEQVNKIIIEFKNRNKLHSFGIDNRRKLLLEGPPGTGKTMTASVIASQLNLPLYTIRLDKVISRFLGETSKKLNEVFETISSNIGVYLFDEFDAIGSDRNLDNEIGEMRRILNSYLQFLENDNSQSLVFAATNDKNILDPALFRRFDDVIHYDFPDEKQIKEIYSRKLSSYTGRNVIDDSIVEYSIGLSHAEVIKVCEEVIKDNILFDKSIDSSFIISVIGKRKDLYDKIQEG